MFIFNLLEWLCNFVSISVLIYTIVMVRKNANHKCLKLVLLYITASCLSDLVSYYYDHGLGLIVDQSIFTAIEIIFFSLFFRSIISPKLSFGILLIPIAIFLNFILNLSDLPLYRNFCELILFEALLLTILSLAYFRNLFTRVLEEDLTKSFNYWLSVGALIYFGGTIPLYFYRTISTNHKFDMQLHSINQILFIAMLALFVKAYRCIKTTY